MASRVGLMASLTVVIATLFNNGVANVHFVGEDMGWTTPSDSNTYSDWAESKDFEVGDTLVFNWIDSHNVAEVSEEDYKSCTTTNPIGSIRQRSPANVTLTSNTTQYFICTVDSHCNRGQKVAIHVGDENAAPSLAAGALSAILSTMIITLLSHYVYTVPIFM